MTDDLASDSGSDLPADRDVYREISEQQDFIELRRRFRRFVVPVTAAFLGWYILYLVCSNWARDLMSTPVAGHLNVALVFGLLQFVSTFVLAWLYARHAAKKLDPLSTEIREELTDRS